MAIRRTQVTVTATGSAGASTGNADTSEIVHGLILSVHLNYSASMAATSDVVIAESNESPAIPVLTVNNNATDGWYYPRITVDGVADGADISGPVDYQSVADYLNVAVTGANNNDSVIATIVWDDFS